MNSPRTFRASHEPGSAQRQRRLRRSAAFAALVIVLAMVLSGCKRGGQKHAEIAYVAAPQANLRDRVAAVYNKAGVVHNGERVEVLEKSRRFLKVRNARGEIGWIEERYLVEADVYDGFEKLAKEAARAPVQAHGTTRASLNIHLTPGRETEHLYQMADGTKVEVLKRETAEKPQSRIRPLLPKAERLGAKKAAATSEEALVPREDWLLVRDQNGHTGWVLARVIDLDVPMEIAQYSEGQRIVAYFVLNEVADEDKKVPQYLVLATENKDGLPWDFDQARIFTWNVKRHRYETAYRERKLAGVFPATVGTADFGKEGVLPTFTLRVKDDDDKTLERKYKLNGPIVRRILSPEEEQAKAVAIPKRRRR
ncbi:MAG: SH3 domain-containing protein [Acidobacteriia bacterium]|nr:SH3 domain-containing protein [Terriglobia bacterium]